VTYSKKPCKIRCSQLSCPVCSVYSRPILSPSVSIFRNVLIRNMPRSRDIISRSSYVWRHFTLTAISVGETSSCIPQCKAPDVSDEIWNLEPRSQSDERWTSCKMWFDIDLNKWRASPVTRSKPRRDECPIRLKIFSDRVAVNCWFHSFRVLLEM
jgi:hypothetical protein